MSRVGKTQRRLIYLLGGTVAISVLGGSAALYRLHYVNEKALQGKIVGQAAMARSDYSSALVQLGRYLSRNPNDAAVLAQYAKARRLVEEPNGQNLGQEISLFQRVLELSPGLPEAQSNLLELYFMVDYNTEAIGIADAILARSPADTSALHIKILAQMRLQRLDQAQATTQQLTSIDPLNLEYQILAIRIMLTRGRQADVEPYAARLAQAHPDDMRFVLLRSIAASLAGNPGAATSFVRPLVTRPQIDATYTQLLVGQLDDMQLFADAFNVLQQAVREHPDRAITQLWINRLFETNRLALLVTQTDGLDPSATSSDVQILGMRVLALSQLKRGPETAPILEALDRRASNEVAAAKWATALRAITTQTNSSDPIQRMRVLRDALRGSDGNPILMEELADAYAAAGARDKALAIWTEVTRTAPAWSVPLVRLSQTLAATGNSADALAAARAAQLRAPEDHDALVSVAIATAANLPAGPSAETTQLLAQLTDLKQRFPNDDDLLPVQVGVLGQAQQRDHAIQVIKSALAEDPPPAERILLSLAGLSEAFKLDQEGACFDFCQKTHGQTAALAFARARWLLNHQRGPEGLALLEKARSSHSGEESVWRTVWATYLDMSADQRAKQEWVALGDGAPNDVRIQWAALSAQAVQADHEFVGRTIDRLITLLGEDSLALRLVRARWLLQGQSSDKDVTQASIMLSDISRNAPDMYAPRLLLATCYMRMGNVSAAIDQLAAVSDMQPDQAGIAIELARLLQSRGDFTRAQQFIDRATRSKTASLQNMRQVASLLALQGDYQKALALLEKTYAHLDQQPPDLVLAALYRQLNDPKRTEEICRSLLEKPDPTSIAFCADFYASQGQLDKADKALALLDGLKMAPGAREVILGDFSSRHGSSNEAIKQFQAAVKAAPTEVGTWKQLVSYCLATGKVDDALAAVDEAGKKGISADEFEALRQNATLVRDAAKIGGTRQLLLTLNGTSANNTAVLDALRIIIAAEKESPRQTAAKLRQLADHNPRVLPLQTITLQYYLQAGQTDEAVTMATAAVQSFPGAVEPLRLATDAFTAAQNWDQALRTATDWQHLGSGETLDADLAIARSDLHLGKVSEATRQIEPYLERAVLEPEKFSGVILLRAQGLLVSHQPAQVEALLGPLLTKSPQWRSLWLSLAVRGVEEPSRAQAWLDQVGPLMEKDLNEQTALSAAWMALGSRWKSPECDRRGRAILESIIQSPNPPVNALLACGTLREAASDWLGAQRVYRQSLAISLANLNLAGRLPEELKIDREKAAIALNNLAYDIVQSGGNLDEARQLINKAVDLAPDRPPFMDTKATVLAALKDYSGAVATMREVQRLDPKNILWRVNLLQILVDSGQTPAARTELQQITAILAATPNVPEDIRQRCESIRTKLQ